MVNSLSSGSVRPLTARDATFRFLDWGPFPKQTFDGWEATRKYWEDIFAAVEDFRMEPEALVSEGDNVVATINATGQGAGSGVEVDMRFAVRCEIRDHKLMTLEVFETRDEALEAAGLSE